ncbi:MAG: hypothetical protein HC824_20600, partial [Synechococcales cyanobacterium RM1_1_8]|nr:hypothetical protein [Synechococcales cyanobacterium RM1_1_8]
MPPQLNLPGPPLGETTEEGDEAFVMADFPIEMVKPGAAGPSLAGPSLAGPSLAGPSLAGPSPAVSPPGLGAVSPPSRPIVNPPGMRDVWQTPEAEIPQAAASPPPVAPTPSPSPWLGEPPTVIASLLDLTASVSAPSISPGSPWEQAGGRGQQQGAPILGEAAVAETSAAEAAVADRPWPDRRRFRRSGLAIALLGLLCWAGQYAICRCCSTGHPGWVAG